MATNLRADTIAQAGEQVRGVNGVSEAAWRRMHLMMFLSVRRTRAHGAVERLVASGARAIEDIRAAFVAFLTPRQ